MNLTSYQDDRLRMKAFVTSYIPEEGCRVVLAEGPEGEVSLDLYAVRHGDGEWGLHWETDSPEAVDLVAIYDFYRREKMTVEEWGREIAPGRCRSVIHRNASTRPAPVEPPPQGTSVQLAMLELIARRLSNLEKLLALSRVKETYTAEEVAAHVQKSAWVVRQWCNKGQVPGAYKIRTGRGKKGEWRIPHEAVARLQNEGPLLLPE